ncbi:uncharacterized protein LOC144160661 [Haemaphysalis longicornis]
MGVSGLAPSPSFGPTPGRPAVPWLQWTRIFENFPLTSDASECALGRRKPLLFHNVGVEGHRIFHALPLAASANANTVQKTTGYSPFLLVYGRDPSFMLDASAFSAPVHNSSPLHEEFISRLNYYRRLARLNTEASQRDRKDRYDSSHRIIRFRPGDEVLLWTPTRKPELCEKFLHRFTGPYTILEETSPVNYRVTPCSAPVDRRYRGTEIVHVSRLKPFVRRSS